MKRVLADLEDLVAGATVCRLSERSGYILEMPDGRQRVVPDKIMQHYQRQGFLEPAPPEGALDRFRINRNGRAAHSMYPGLLDAINRSGSDTGWVEELFGLAPQEQAGMLVVHGEASSRPPDRLGDAEPRPVSLCLAMTLDDLLLVAGQVQRATNILQQGGTIPPLQFEIPTIVNEIDPDTRMSVAGTRYKLGGLKYMFPDDVMALFEESMQGPQTTGTVTIEEDGISIDARLEYRSGIEYVHARTTRKALHAYIGNSLGEDPLSRLGG